MQTPSEQRQQDPCREPCVSAVELIGIYYQQPDQLGKFEQVSRGSVPEAYRELLDHTDHMTVTVESHHADRVDVQVLQSDISGDHYRREILLRTHSQQKVVQSWLKKNRWAVS